MTLGGLLSEPGARRGFVAGAAAALGTPLPDVLVSAGAEPLVATSMLAGELGLPMAYLRPKPKSHGRQQRVEGRLQGSAALLVAGRDAEAERDYAELVTASGARVAQVLDVHAVTAAEGNPHPGPLPEGAGNVERALLDIGAVIVRGEPFRYASGLLSPIYTDCRLLISHPRQWQAVLAGLAARLDGGTFDAIDGVATSGIPHAGVLAYRADKPLAYVSDGSIAGAPPAGSRLLVIEDLVTTGKSVLEAADALRAAGMVVERCLTIFTYDRRQPKLDEAGIAFEALGDLRRLLEVGVEGGFFGPAEREAVLDWRRDPQGWTARHEPG